VLQDARQSLHELVLSKGLEVFAKMLEDDRTALCGPKHRPQGDRVAYRYGHDEGQQVLGGRKVRLRKPRVRSVTGRELELPTWREMNQEDPLNQRVIEQMLVGVSTRNYGRSLEPLPAAVPITGTSRSAVSRHFVASTRSQVEKFLSRRLDDLDLPVCQGTSSFTSLGDIIFYDPVPDSALVSALYFLLGARPPLREPVGRPSWRAHFTSSTSRAL
jgi:transposase-like protein